MKSLLIRAWAIEVGRGNKRQLRVRQSPPVKPRGAIGEAWRFWNLGVWSSRYDARCALRGHRATGNIATRFARVAQIRITVKVAERKR